MDAMKNFVNVGPPGDLASPIRDMIRSHLLQVMALVMRDLPLNFDRGELPALTVHVLRSTRIWDDDPSTAVIRCRCAAGKLDGRSLPAYTTEDGVDPANETETFAQVTLEVDIWRWSDVPATLRSGKAVGSPRQETAVTFRRPPHTYSLLGGDPTISVLGDAAEEGWRSVEDILDAFDSGAAPLRDYRAEARGRQPRRSGRATTL